jgi:hypothetical protein
LILVTSDPGAGYLKREGLADRVLSFTHRLVSGPIPAGGPPERFFQRRQSLYETEGLFHEPWWFEAEDLDGTNPRFKRVWSKLPELCVQHDPITLWIDPDANAQLLLVQLLDWLGSLPQIAPRLWLKQPESPLARRRPGDWLFPPRRIDQADIALAGRAWRAFAAPDPRAWAALRDDAALARLPGLGRTVALMLDELPDATGLGATERRLLRLAERQGWWDEAARLGIDVADERLKEADRTLGRLIERTLELGESLPLWEFEMDEKLVDLAAAPCPALSGITERSCDLQMYLDRARYRQFRDSPVWLTDLGRRLVARGDDWSRHNPVHRWWGGTRLTNATLWRWNAESGQLSPPQ